MVEFIPRIVPSEELHRKRDETGEKIELSGYSLGGMGMFEIR